MGQARNRGTREQRVAEAIARNEAEEKTAAERAETMRRQIEINTLAQSITLGLYAAGRRPAPAATSSTKPEAL